MSFKYIFMGSPNLAATVLEYLAQKKKLPELVITQPTKPQGRGRTLSSTPVSQIAQKLNIPVLEAENANDPSVIKKIKELDPDLLLVIAFGQILKEELLKIPKAASLNLHASLLPKYRGAAPVQRALWEGEKVSGLTLQKMVKELDAGDIFLTQEMAIEETDTSFSLLNKMEKLAGPLCENALYKIEKKELKFTPQDPKQVTWAPKIKKEEAWIRWEEPASRIERQIRALQPWPVARTRMEKESLIIFKAEVSKEPSSLSPGEVHTDHKNFLEVGTGRGLLRLTEVQRENRKRLEIKEFLRAFQGKFPHLRLQSGGQ